MPGDDRAEPLADYSAAPRLELDQLLTQLIDQAQDVVAARDRLRGLLRANRLIIGDLALPVVLRRIAEAARDLVQARYTALGVLGPDGGLEQFIHVGVDEDRVARIGHLPEGKGLLGALIDDPHPIRLANLADDPRSAGFPEGHPQMRSFLGVPIRIRDEVYGNLYLTERAGGPFTAEDEELVAALAATAASAIDNARLYAEAGRRQRWLEASTEITRQLLSSEGEPPLSVIARRLHEMADADVVAVVLPTADQRRLMVEVATGEHAAQLTALTYPVEDTIAGVAINTGRPVLIGDVTQQETYTVHLAELTPVGPMMALPLLATKRSRGAVLVARVPGRRRFNEADLDIATTFAQHAAVALELADARADQQRMMLLEDRDRIARDLHDHVIQRLFAAGLTVQSMAAGVGTDSGASRLNRVVDDLDETIRQIRTTIFELRGPLAPQSSTVRSQVVGVADEVAPALGFSPALRFTGAVDTIVADDLAADLIAVVREGLSNIARHAHASAAEVEVTATPAELTVDVTDNGVGIGESRRSSGLANLARRAERYGGSLTLPEHEGTHLRWTIPLK
ncbi:MAG TPA: GAF domain-containing protein [Jatrophihabitantaceae bacterium]|jgi:signal transduction histidine kinase